MKKIFIAAAITLTASFSSYSQAKKFTAINGNKMDLSQADGNKNGFEPG